MRKKADAGSLDKFREFGVSIAEAATGLDTNEPEDKRLEKVQKLAVALLGECGLPRKHGASTWFCFRQSKANNELFRRAGDPMTAYESGRALTHFDNTLNFEEEEIILLVAPKTPELFDVTDVRALQITKPTFVAKPIRETKEKE